MKTGRNYLGFLPYILLAVMAAQAVGVGMLGHIKLCMIQLAVLVAAAVFAVIYDFTKHRRLAGHLDSISASMSPGASSVMKIDIPVMAVRDDRIIWYNPAFRKTLLAGDDCVGMSPGFIVMPELIQNAFGDGSNIEYKGHSYRFFAVSADDGITLCYFVDRTDAVQYRQKFEQGRPVAVYITVDNIDEIMRGTRDSEGARISSIIEKRIENWAMEMGALCRKVGGDRFLIVTDETGLGHMKDTRFDILTKVRSIDFGQRGHATLSIGVGYSADNFAGCEEYARQALDMALGRGGDQASVRDSKDFEFFGGTSSTVSKRSKVRTRMVASALGELVADAENILIMGHRFADFDSFGACFGLYNAVKAAGKPVRIVVRLDKCMCKPLADYVLKDKDVDDVIASPERALELVDKNTLLIIADTHRPTFVESPELYEAVSAVVVIDHHRKTVDHIDNAVIFYHDPYASSACEMVSELIQYMPVKMGKTEAEALLAGITLDTRNFVLNTGVRTFEASAYLRECGASTVTVKGFFQNSIEEYKLRAAVVSAAQVYNKCAVSFSNEQNEFVRIACAQAADDMLGIENVDASFVLFYTGSTVNISARSLGRINVQLIMEQLGGGGHLTMAACQLENNDIETALVLLQGAIDEYERQNEH